MASPCFSFLVKILLCISLLCLLCIVHGADEMTVPVSSLFPSPNCEASTSNGNSTLKLFHKHGPCSPLFKGEQVNHTQLLQDDIARVKWIQSKLSSADATSSLEDSPTSRLEAKYGPFQGTYLTTIGLGTPKTDVTVMFDTGSSLTWTQCTACAAPCYDPLQSSSYANIAFQDPSCSQLASATGGKIRDSGSNCYFKVGYMDMSTVEGLYATETLTISPTDALTNFKFGCVQKATKYFEQTAGLLGLSRDPISFIGQYGQYFSYCLPPLVSSMGYLAFSKTSMTYPFVRFTRLSTLPQTPSFNGFYGIKITGISVKGEDLGIDSSVFSDVPTIIDSGTTITRLPRVAYEALRSAFKQGMKEYKEVGQTTILDTCYDLTGYAEVTVPVIRFTFNGEIAVDLGSSSVLYAAQPSQTCLAFAEIKDAPGISIYGNVQQRTFEVVYDLAGGCIGFRPEGCF